MRSPGRFVPLLAAALVGCAPTAGPPIAAGLSQCTRDSLDTMYRGVFTVATDQPVYPPWYMGDNPENGEGFESAVAYAVAAGLGYQRDDVRWVRVPFNAALAPGGKEFDASLSEFSITDQRRAAVDFSAPYFDVTQAVVTRKSSPAAAARSVAALKPLRLGVQVGTTSYSAATSVNGVSPVSVYSTNVDAKMALSSGEIDALVADLPTAFAVANELSDGVMVGQLPAGGDDVEQFGIVLNKDSSLTRCVSSVVDALRDDGTLAALQTTWLAEAGKAPLLR
ncbi:ABC transporter substrate-binding protein [Mycobacterium sp. ITM-2016-00318]|uniref:ABC transporter substrate-binding protein n=1 Tax=Mycobacterium sp. ITM-2016-00318 TaxID=2099693 RepID=UPI0018EE0D7D|nr:ABC transporter substrate-binding protein [Mycobacterium sp. ITM-2016-00318]WNG92255.1 ABC transporter substrate-binding protein [Mycobacterium sp. ITM-2016-00318]